MRRYRVLDMCCATIVLLIVPHTQPRDEVDRYRSNNFP